ncbi:hypothetical protein LCGC14_1283680 [marine sediment metagenome]|uniref:Uncharacterized protein n=1 Tax=marine sediment metagenome TaxID=412755 RepID=A0A0F9KW80_9ZZZZ
MALVRYGGGILDARGSIGGQVHSRNRFGAYIRARVTPVNPRTFRQAVVRAIVGAQSGEWSNTLTQLQRDAWEVYADAIVFQNKLGAQIKLTGFNHFIRSNAIRAQSAAPFVADGPGVLTLAPPDETMLAVVDEATQLISVSFDNTQPWANQTGGIMPVFMSSPKQIGTNFIGGPFRFAGAVIGDLTTPPTSPETFPVPFPVAQNQVVVVRARVSEEDGRLSELFRSQSSVTA